MKTRKPAAHSSKMLFALLLFCAALVLLVNGVLTPRYRSIEGGEGN
jgi:hypothetical protein